jgi:hypothetical protein
MPLDVVIDQYGNHWETEVALRACSLVQISSRPAGGGEDEMLASLSQFLSSQ